MAKRKSIMGGFDFQKIDPYGSVITAQTAVSTFHIESLLPDPLQPRNLLPSELDEPLLSGQQKPGAILQEWLKQADAPTASYALKNAVEKLRQLAATIQHKGLINPITVRQPTPNDRPLPPGVSHIIVTGERRWWAHVLLANEGKAIGDGEYPEQIRATVVPVEGVRALQLIENVAREDLSVIEKAHGIMGLREELSAGLDEAVAWGEVEAILGISRSYRSRLLKVLKLSKEAQAMVAEHNLLEKTVRPVTENLLDRPDLQVVALRQIITWQASEEESSGHQQIAAYVQRLLARNQTISAVIQPNSTEKWLTTFRKNVTGTLKLLEQLEEEELDQAIQSVIKQDADARRQLQRLRAKIDAMLSEF